MCRGQRGRHANQIAAFDFWGMPGLIYLTLHTAESTLIGGGDSSAFGSIKSPPPPKYSNKFLFILLFSYFWSL